MTRPYRELIEQEIERAEADLAGFRSRAITVVSTSSGVVTLLTGLITFSASKAEQDEGLRGLVIVLLAIGFLGFLIAAGIALWSNTAKGIERPSGDDLLRLASDPDWTTAGEDPSEEERQVARVSAVYLKSIRTVADQAADRLTAAIVIQIAALLVTAIAGLVAIASIN